MSRTIIEKFLLTKFRSSKEDELAVLDTSRDGEDWRLLFRADRSYELLKCPEPIEGTRVALHKEMDSAAYAAFAAKSGEAVRLWCRHSEVEVGFAAGLPDGSPPPAPEPVRQAFHVDAPFEVELVEEGTQIVAGVARDSPPVLRLLQPRTHPARGAGGAGPRRHPQDRLAFARAHPRDNVRRDTNFGKAMALVKKLGSALEASSSDPRDACGLR